MQLTPGLKMLESVALYIAGSIATCVGTTFLGYRLGVLSALTPWTFLLPLPTLPLFVGLKFSLTALAIRRRASARGARLPPIVKGKLVGNVDIMREIIGKVETDYIGSGVFSQLVKKYGSTLNIRICWDNMFFTCEPSHIKAVLASSFDSWEKGHRWDIKAHSVFGIGVFNSDGDMWKLHRSMTRPFFTHDRIGHFDIFDNHAEEAITVARERLRAGYAVDFQDLISRFTIDSATEFLFGHCVHTLFTPLPYPHNAPISLEEKVKNQDMPSERFATAFADAQTTVAMRMARGGAWRFWEIFEDLSEKPMKIVREYLEPIIADAIEKHREKQRDGELGKEREEKQIQEGETLLDHLVRLTTDMVVIRDEVVNIMIAGRDTTASTLTMVIYFLAKHPHVMDRLREEILTKVGPSRRPTYDDIREMKYLRAVLNETLRLFPPVPFNVRQSTEDTTFPPLTPEGQPMFIPGKSLLVYSVLLMHRRTDLWGPDAIEFDPDRFIDERLQKYLVPNPFIFLPFNAGPRICLGQQFAYNEMSFMLIRLLQNFSRIELDRESQPPDSRPPAHWKDLPGRASIEEFHPRSHVTLYSKGGMWVRMTEADPDDGVA